MPVRLSPLLLAVLAAACVWMMPTRAQAQSCTFSVSEMNFGTVDTLSGSPTNSTATVTANCSGNIISRILICPYLGAGSGGATGGLRQMIGDSTLSYQLYSDSGRSVVWGSYTAPFATGAPPMEVTTGLSGSGSASMTIYGRVPAGQAATLTSSYISTFSGASTEFRYLYSLLGNTCNTAVGTLFGSPAFNVRALVSKTCTLSTTNVDFGSKGVLSANVDATGTISVNCTPSAPYTISLGNGQTGTGPAARRMTLGGQFVTYGLYKDNGRSQVWGDASTAGSTFGGTGNGATQNITVYGRVPPQNTPSPGTYTDTVVVTVTY